MASAARVAKPYSGTMSAIPVDSTPSLLYNNLSTNGDRVAYIHKARVHLFNEAATESKVEVDPETIKDVPGAISATWVEMDDHYQLVVCGTAGVQAYEQVASNAGKLNPVWSDNICERMEAPAGTSKHCRGAASIGKDRVAVGTFTGEIAVYVAGKVQSPMLSGHGSSITCIHASQRRWVSADDGGTIIAWSGDAPSDKFSGDGFPCTSVVTRGDTVIGGFACGHIRVFRIGLKAAIVELSAHARCVTALAIHPSLPLFASVGEDTVLNVFNVPTEDEAVEVSFTTTVTDRLLTGVQFSQRNASSSDVMTCAYDSHSVSVWHNE